MAIRYEINGKTVLLTQTQFNRLLDGDDELLEKLIADDQGVYIEDPFEEIKVKEFKEIALPEDLTIEDLPEDLVQEIKKQLDES